MRSTPLGYFDAHTSVTPLSRSAVFVKVPLDDAREQAGPVSRSILDQKEISIRGHVPVRCPAELAIQVDCLG